MFVNNTVSMFELACTYQSCQPGSFLTHIAAEILASMAARGIRHSLTVNCLVLVDY